MLHILSSRSRINWHLVAWLFCAVLLIIDLSYLLFDLLPFYINGVGGEPTEAVRGGPFDPTGYVPYNRALTGHAFYGAAILSFGMMALLALPIAMFQSLATLLSWKQQSRKARSWLVLVGSGSVLLSICCWTILSIIGVWLAD